MQNGNDASYLESYADINVHRLMLDDEPRTLAYKNAIFGNKTRIEGKVVMDIGCGTGILSIFCAQVGARKVHAVECSSMAKLARKVVTENGFDGVVTVHECRVEDLVLDEKVDIIVSEWMGFYLLHEGMLSSVIFARDAFLKPGGLMFPESAEILAAACQLPEYFDYWKNVYGVKMESIGEFDRKSRQEPAVSIVALENVLTEPVTLQSYSLNTVTIEETKEVRARSLRPAFKDGQFNGICLWFHVTFPSCNDEVFSLKTGPGDPDTHWKQTIVILPVESGATHDVAEGDPSTFFEVALKCRENDQRKYVMEVGLVDASEVEHEVPCDCFSAKCTIIRAYIEGSGNNDVDTMDVLDEEEPEN